MLEILEFIFKSPIHFFGFCILWCIMWGCIACIGNHHNNEKE